MSDYGVKISQAGKDVTSTEPRDFVFNSAYDTVKIFKQGSGSVTIPSGSSSASVNIAHGLSFTPMYLVLSELSYDSGKWFANSTKLSDDDPDAGRVYVQDGYSYPPYQELGLYVDGTNLHLEYNTYDSTQSRTIRYYYYIFGDKGS